MLSGQDDCRLTLERHNQLEPWISALADEFNEAALQAEADDAKKQADALLADVEKERRQTDRLRLKDDSRDRRRRSRSRERDRCVSCACQVNTLYCMIQSMLACWCWSGRQHQAELLRRFAT